VPVVRRRHLEGVRTRRVVPGAAGVAVWRVARARTAVTAGAGVQVVLLGARVVVGEANSERLFDRVDSVVLSDMALDGAGPRADVNRAGQRRPVGRILEAPLFHQDATAVERQR